MRHRPAYAVSTALNVTPVIRFETDHLCPTIATPQSRTVAAAALVAETGAMAKAAGLADISLTPKTDYIDSMEDWKDKWYGGVIKHLPTGARLSDYVTSLYVEARKPSSHSP